MDCKEIMRFYYYFTSEETGLTLNSIRPVYNNAFRGKGSQNSKFHNKIPNSLRLHHINYIVMKHAKESKVACRKILNCLKKKHSVYCSKHTLSRAMLDISLSFKPSKPKLRNNNVARIDQIRDCLISLHALLNLDKEGKAVLIYLY